MKVRFWNQKTILDHLDGHTVITGITKGENVFLPDQGREHTRESWKDFKGDPLLLEGEGKGAGIWTASSRKEQIPWQITKTWRPQPQNHKQQPDWLGFSSRAWSRQEFSLSNSRFQSCGVLSRTVTLTGEIMNMYCSEPLELMCYGYNGKHKLLNTNVLKYRIT